MKTEFRKNNKLIFEADVDGLPLHQHSFDLITSIKKHNWWHSDNIRYTSNIAEFIDGDIFSGSFNFCEDMLKEKYGISIPYSLSNNLIYFPDDILKRKIMVGNVDTFYELIKEYPEGVFVKPMNLTKLFTGSFIENETQYKLLVDGITDKSIPFLYSAHIDIISEYRLWVSEEKVLSVKHYLGDNILKNKFSLNENVVNLFIKKFNEMTYNNTPKLYVLDFAILADGSTTLIEINDAFGTGTYGYDEKELIENYIGRYNQLFKLL